ncbi:hypothetical protein AFLA_011831 [Aspergillus flavus NRRL3357]|nr:hypothetical protein AFLA_011831 [Aspergillus flavus NRRL3357]
MVLQHHHINIFDPLCRVTQESVFSPSKTIRAYRFFPFRIRTPDSPPNEIDASVFHGTSAEDLQGFAVNPVGYAILEHKRRHGIETAIKSKLALLQASYVPHGCLLGSLHSKPRESEWNRAQSLVAIGGHRSSIQYHGCETFYSLVPVKSGTM